MCFIRLDTFSGLWVTMMATLQWPTGCQQKWRGKPGEMKINWRFKRQKSERNGTYHAKRSSAKIGEHPGAPYCNCSDKHTYIALFVSPNEHMTRTKKYVIQKHQQKWTNIVVIYCIIWLISIDLVYMRPMIYCTCIFIAYTCTVYITIVIFA